MSEPQNNPPKSTRRKPVEIAVFFGCLGHLALLALISVANALGPDRWWMSGLNMYLPQWAWGLPIIALFPLSLWRTRRWSWIPLLSLLWVAGPVMGFRWGSSEGPNGLRIRVMTHNVQWWQAPWVDPIARKIKSADPDIVCLQDARGAVDAGLRDLLVGWHVTAFGQYVIASKFPITETIVGDISFRGEKHSYLRARLKAHGRFITVCTVHFTTPRDGLAALRHLDAGGIGGLKRNLDDRITQARSLAKDLRSVTDPLIVAGDLNAPIQSLSCRKLLDLGLRSAFDTAGRGYGYTYGHTHRFRHSFTRIDHILGSRHFTSADCSVGEPGGSDHRPVIGDLILAE